MIECLRGVVQEAGEKQLTLLLGGCVGIALAMPQTAGLQKNEETTVYTYLHWNQEQGPSLYGFASPAERAVFLMIIECPKIGPSIALSILSQLRPLQFLEVVAAQNHKALSAVNGIGPKKAEQLVVTLKHSAQKMLAAGDGKFQAEKTSGAIDWQQVSEVLLSLNYSKQEIGSALQHLAQKYTGEEAGFDQVLRSALGFLAGKTA